MTNTKHLTDLRRRRTEVRIIVLVGILISIGANIIDAATLLDAAFAGWPPVALLLLIEILSRVPTSRRIGTFFRVLATTAVAFAAGWLSYWNMADAASQHAETGGSQYIWPIPVDGLMVVASVALVELGARIRSIETALTDDPPTWPAGAQSSIPVPVEVSAEQRVEIETALSEVDIAAEQRAREFRAALHPRSRTARPS